MKSFGKFLTINIPCNHLIVSRFHKSASELKKFMNHLMIMFFIPIKVRFILKHALIGVGLHNPSCAVKQRHLASPD